MTNRKRHRARLTISANGFVLARGRHPDIGGTGTRLASLKPGFIAKCWFWHHCNAFHMTDLPSDGRLWKIALLTLKDSSVKPEDIDYINAHGSSTRMNDIFETSAYKAVFGITLISFR
jgi:hypothetical protein